MRKSISRAEIVTQQFETLLFRNYQMSRERKGDQTQQDRANPFSPPGDSEGQSTTTKPRSISRLLLGIAAIGVGLFFVVLFLLPLTRSARGPARRSMCQNNLKNLALAIYNYHTKHDGQFPPPFTQDEDGNRLHSWRTLLLPALDRQDLFEQIDFTKPWDAPENESVRNAPAPTVFACPESMPVAGFTTYQPLTGPRAFFAPDGRSRSRDEFAASGNILMLVETDSASAAHWMDPHAEVSAESFVRQPPGVHSGVFNVAFIDGRVKPIDVDTPQKVLRSLASIDDGEPETDNW